MPSFFPLLECKDNELRIQFFPHLIGNESNTRRNVGLSKKTTLLYPQLVFPMNVFTNVQYAFSTSFLT